MKKITGILVVIVFSIAMFFNNGIIDSKKDLNLASVISINIVNAESGSGNYCAEGGIGCNVGTWCRKVAYWKTMDCT